MNQYGSTGGMRGGAGKYQRGFTLFELVVYILVVSIVFTAGFRRFSEFPSGAERANFQAIMMQLKAGVNMQMMNSIARGDWNELEIDGSNPMDLMLETPVNYIGEFSLVDPAAMPERVWYFDNVRGELVYLANDSEGLFAIVDGVREPTDQIRFRITAKYRNGERRWEGLQLEAVIPYDWEAPEIELPLLLE